MKKFQPSAHQQAIFDFIANEHGSAIVKAVAGSGKTTTILHALEFIPQGASVLMLAFNASIAKELKERITAKGKELGRVMTGVEGRTFHSLGFGAVCKHLGRSPNQISTDANKCRTIVREEFSLVEQRVYGDFITRLVSLAKGQGVGVLVEDDDPIWHRLINHHDLTLDTVEGNDQEAVALARRLLALSNEIADTGVIDFDDQLYLPLLWRCQLRPFDYVFIDEAQDTNPVRRALAKLALRPGGRLIAVGDPKQAIYGFTGASHDAMDLIAEEFDTRELPLSVSYRCARRIVEAAQELVPYIEPSDDAPEGIVERTTLKKSLDDLTASDAILCRLTAPLVTLAFKLIASGRGCTILGREIGQGLINLIEKQRSMNLDALRDKLATYLAREVARFTARGEEQKAAALEDKVACIETIITALPETERTIPQLIGRIAGLFSDSNGVLTLSTIHKAKGREWERVAILMPELMPSKWARQTWQVAQEHNLQYVAYTRARRHLILTVGEPDTLDLGGK